MNVSIRAVEAHAPRGSRFVALVSLANPHIAKRREAYKASPDKR